jgi:predicted dehydrogenase
MSEKPLRIGILGAARIAPMALVRPARHVEGVQVAAVAARDPRRAQEFARKQGIARALDSYEALVNDPEIDAIYNPLPNSLHAKWTMAALAAGKHVLCEKPFTANAEEATTVAAAADKAGRVVMEAFHYRYHPLAQRVRDIIDSGDLGTLQRVETWMCFPLPMFSDIRYRHDLAGGSLMDAGCYAVHMARTFGREEPRVVSAVPKLHTPDIDRAMSAELQYPSGHLGRVHSSMWSAMVLRMAVHITGDKGELHLTNPILPQAFHRLRVVIKGKRRKEALEKALIKKPTYQYQLEAFLASVRKGVAPLTPPSDSIANMRVIDAIYVAAGMRPRG